MEWPRETKDEKSVFHDRLLAEGLVNEVRPGLSIKADDYTFLQGDEFSVQILIDNLTTYLATPTLIDSFSSHKDRIQAFNRSGVLDSETSNKLYLSNRLRVNKILNAFGALDMVETERRLPESFRDFVKSEIKDLDLGQYNSLDTQQKILFTERLAALCASVLNLAVAENIIAGPTL